jgi:hypothetical protein
MNNDELEEMLDDMFSQAGTPMNCSIEEQNLKLLTTSLNNPVLARLLSTLASKTPLADAQKISTKLGKSITDSMLSTPNVSF